MLIFLGNIEENQARFYVVAGGQFPQPDPCPQIFGYSSSMQ